ncbi:hypothetical protein A2164_00935 [Candidatus Curtissbacteria bacterium RBG_13_35_7]|uniref:Uncharacterized protein n=1 Tax=Candidatus Curtissbacteria bacterium RBG_13_35_7 TaxID=1797705 RepID=A0A1F5G1X8_9BACT|nr:MAG: hypothetical protein A2164_00935 [Candidatus Curtissbacteria bacterium RBG_13_35_7]
MRTLGKLTRRFPRGVIINSHPEQFVTRTGSDMQVQIPLAKTALRSPIQTGKGTILGGTSLDALSRARKQTRRK